MGSKGQQVTTDTSQTYTPNPTIGAAGTQAVTSAQNLAQTPFNMPTAPVAGFTPFQNQAFGQTQAFQGLAQPYFNLGQNYLQQSAAPISAGQVANYYNPMAQNVTNQLQNIFGQQQQATTGQLTQAAGGVGADRIAVGQSELANQQGLAAGQTYAGLYQQALQAAQQQNQMAAGAGYGISQMGPAALNAAITGTGALGAAGAQQQQLSQAQQNAAYQNQLAGIAWPYQNTQYLASIAGGLAPALGGTTQGQSTTTYPAPSALSQALGVGTSAMGLFGGFGGFSGLGGSLGKGATAGADPAAMLAPLVLADGGAATYGKLADSAYRRDLSGMMPQAQSGNPYDMEALQDIGGSLPMFADGGDTEPQPPPVPGLAVPRIGGGAPIPYLPLGVGGGHSGLMQGEGINLQKQMPYAIGPSGIIGSYGGQGGSNSVGSQAMQAIRMAQIMGDSYNRGGYIADGGAVNPYDFGQHFDAGGDVLPGEDPYGVGNPALYGDYPGQPNLSAGDIQSAAGNFYGGLLKDAAKTYYGPAMEALGKAGQYVKQKWDETAPDYQGTPAAVANPVAPPAAPVTSPAGVPLGGYPSIPGGGVPQARPVAPPAAAVQPPPVRPPAVFTPTMNADMTPQHYTQPQEPYPDALHRDWGQQLARSPWMSLVKAGAAMASSPGPIGTAIARGISAGAGELDAQRKSLQTEEGVNQKAQSLYQQAMQHLDQYQRMTPAQAATEKRAEASLAISRERLDLAQNRFSTLPAGTLARLDNEVRTDPRFIGESEENIQAEIASRASTLANIRGATTPHAGGSAASAQPDPGPGQRIKGMWYIGPTGKPQQWNG